MKSSELITNKDLPSISSEVDQLAANLAAHENLGIAASHGNVTVVNEAVYDNSSTPFDDSPGSPTGNKVGTITLVIRSAGYTYRIPASTSPLGVPFVPQLSAIVPAEAFSYAPGGEPQPNVGVSCDATFTQPATISWQVYVGSAWETLNTNFAYYNGLKVASPVTWSFQPVSSTFAYNSSTTTISSGDMLFTTPSGSTATSLSQALVLTFPAFGSTGKIYLGKIRLAVDNTASGGGIKYSAACNVSVENITDCI